tara:strand:- start:10198 stop:10629 length:432 start_codon:yes stop_codon:yes gene_type:complete
MKKSINLLLLIVIATFQFSCSSDDDTNADVNLSSKSVTDCGLGDITDTSLNVCLDGAELALPNENITYAAKYNSLDADFKWTIMSGSMEVINVENSISDGFSKSIATIKFNSDFNGQGIIEVFAEDSRGSGGVTHAIELEETN